MSSAEDMVDVWQFVLGRRKDRIIGIEDHNIILLILHPITGAYVGSAMACLFG